MGAEMNEESGETRIYYFNDSERENIIVNYYDCENSLIEDLNQKINHKIHIFTKNHQNFKNLKNSQISFNFIDQEEYKNSYGINN